MYADAVGLTIELGVLVRAELDLEEAQALEKAEIVTFKGFSGKPTTAEIAFQAPAICQMHSSAGHVYNLERDGIRLVATEV